MAHIIDLLKEEKIEFKEHDIKIVGSVLKEIEALGRKEKVEAGKVIEIRNEISEAIAKLIERSSERKKQEISEEKNLVIELEDKEINNIEFKVKEGGKLRVMLKGSNGTSYTKVRVLFEQQCKDCELQLLYEFRDMRNIVVIELIVEKGAKGRVFIGGKGSGSNYLAVKTLMEEKGDIETYIRVLPLKNSKLVLDFYSQHKDEETKNLIDIRSIILDDVELVKRGLIRVEENAKNTFSIMNFSTLNLAEKARVVEIPRLEIKNNEVVTTHQASSMKIEEEQVFYLMSRGLSKREAIKLIIDSFFSCPMFEDVEFFTKEIK